MAVPSGDQRDYDFAKKFGLEIKNIFKGIDISKSAFEEKANFSECKTELAHLGAIKKYSI